MIILKGTYDILIKDKKTEFRFTIKRKYTLLIGDSATGKSKLYKMLESPETFIEVSSLEGQGVGIFPLASRRDVYTRMLPCSEPTIFVIDEGVQGYLDIEFKDLMHDSNAYFIIISRKKLVYTREDSNGVHKESLPLSINEIYRISTQVRSHSIMSEYYSNTFTNVYKTISSGFNIETILTEDSGSGFAIYSHCFPEADAYTAHGNANLIAKLRDIDKLRRVNGIIAIFLDGSVYGVYIQELIFTMRNCSNSVVVYAPESLEWVLLNVIPKIEFSFPFNEDVLINSQNYCDNDAFSALVSPYTGFKHSFESWEQLYTAYLTYLMSKTDSPYSKSKTVNNFYLRFTDQIVQLIRLKL